MKRNDCIEVLIVGGGQGGVSLAYYLKKLKIQHLVLERDRAFSSWYNRWDGFRTNTPNWMNSLPALDANNMPSNYPDKFATRDELVDYFEQCLDAIDPPIKTNTSAHRVVQLERDGWQVYTENTIYEARNVAICIGAMSLPKLPAAAADIACSVPQLHSSAYQNQDQITTASVLLVGSGSSGVQICRLLAQDGRFEKIHLSVSKVLVLPYQMFGVQTHRFLHFLGLFDVRANSLLGRLMYSGLETRGDPIMRPSPQDLAEMYGVRLYGKFIGSDGTRLCFADGQALQTNDVTIIWCTGFRGDYTFIEPINRIDVFDVSGYPLHSRGVANGAPGLYFVGLRYQHTVASHDIYGVSKDARYVAEHIRDNFITRTAGAKDS